MTIQSPEINIKPGMRVRVTQQIAFAKASATTDLSPIGRQRWAWARKSVR